MQGQQIGELSWQMSSIAAGRYEEGIRAERTEQENDAVSIFNDLAKTCRKRRVRGSCPMIVVMGCCHFRASDSGSSSTRFMIPVDPDPDHPGAVLPMNLQDSQTR